MVSAPDHQRSGVLISMELFFFFFFFFRFRFLKQKNIGCFLLSFYWTPSSENVQPSFSLCIYDFSVPTPSLSKIASHGEFDWSDIWRVFLKVKFKFIKFFLWGDKLVQHEPKRLSLIQIQQTRWPSFFQEDSFAGFLTSCLHVLVQTDSGPTETVIKNACCRAREGSAPCAVVCSQWPHHTDEVSVGHAIVAVPLLLFSRNSAMRGQRRTSIIMIPW